MRFEQSCMLKIPLSPSVMITPCHSLFFMNEGKRLIFDWLSLVTLDPSLYDRNRSVWSLPNQVVMNFRKNHHANRPADQGQNISTLSVYFSTQKSPNSQSNYLLQNTPTYRIYIRNHNKDQNEWPNHHCQCLHRGICTCCLYPYLLASKTHGRYASLKGNDSSSGLPCPYCDTWHHPKG